MRLAQEESREGHSRIGVSVQAQEVDLGLGGTSRIAGGRCLQCPLTIQCQSRAIGILVRIEEHVRAVIFVVTDSSARGLGCNWR